MTRKDFIRNTLMAFAVSLLPKTLLPAEYEYTETKIVAKYVAGFAVVSKQFMRNLPYLQAVLPSILLRDFSKEENP